jgi:undecaprenyl-diphosphatase
MRGFVSTVTNWDVVFLTRIVDSDGRKLFSSTIPWFSHTGNGYYYPFIPLLLYLFNTEVALRFTFAGIIAFSLELPIYKLVKNCIRRDRPFEAILGVDKRISPSDRFSFPSGHTAGAFIVALLIGHFLPLLFVPCFIWASLVGLSRIYLGVHYPTDVLAGMVLGLVSGWIGLNNINWVLSIFG